MSRIDQVQLGDACEELGKSWQKIISRAKKTVFVGVKLTYTPTESSRVGVVKALTDRAVNLGSHEGDLVEVCHAYNNDLSKFLMSSLGHVLRL